MSRLEMAGTRHEKELRDASLVLAEHAANEIERMATAIRTSDTLLAGLVAAQLQVMFQFEVSKN